MEAPIRVRFASEERKNDCGLTHSMQKLGLCLLERCPLSLTLMNLQRSNRRAARRAVPSGSCMLTPRKSLLEIKNEKIPIRLIEVLEPCPIEDPPVTTFPPSNHQRITN